MHVIYKVSKPHIDGRMAITTTRDFAPDDVTDDELDQAAASFAQEVITIGWEVLCECGAITHPHPHRGSCPGTKRERT